MGVKCCVCLKDKKPANPNINNQLPPKEEKAPILDLNDIKASLPDSKPLYNPQSSLQVDQFKSDFLKAITEENLYEITELISKGFPILEPISNEKFTALHIACKLGKLSVVSHLIEKIPGVLIDLQDENEKWTPLMLASINGHIEIIKYLLGKKARKDLLSEENKTALDYAKQMEFIEIMKILKE